MTDTQRDLYNYQRAQAKARAERRKERAKARGLDTVSSKRRRRAIILNWRAERKKDLWYEGSCDVITGLTTMHHFRPTCGLCGVMIEHFEECELDHKIPVRRGGDTDENTHLVHTLGNRAKASVELSKYLELPLAIRRKNCGISG